ncbi:hypothetical protein JFU37_23285 [Pseudomonas sp. TH41]|uniref:hypothetical protein n=1 Tax=Pseudomonas sp. TH41 TaxID=2796405 RepID=UPI001913A7D4|nr:hypothetical protein [Pseudomonas sp. TH41]MBK5355413.1 hypothetical protein [Pseudomonas sp. TH41]
MIKDIVEFLTPGQEPIQITFFSVIALGVALSILSVSFKANAKSWQRKWEGEALDSSATGLEVEHGSISELSQAVATPAEKLASMMPGLLLIIGLLGTFLGLGLALDKASSILQSSGSSVGAMDDSMQNLMAMMQGLGTKFKTSTWGIIAFILLKVWESWSGFEERRLTWCINKMKGELGKARAMRIQEKLASEEKLQASLTGSSQLVVTALESQTEDVKAEMSRQNIRAQQLAERRNAVWLQKFEIVAAGFSGLNASNRELAEQAAARDVLIAKGLEPLISIVSLASQSNKLLSDFSQSSLENQIALNASNREQAEQAAARDVLIAKGLEPLISIVSLAAESNKLLSDFSQSSLENQIALNASNRERAEQEAARDVLIVKGLEPLISIVSLAAKSNKLLSDFTQSSQENQIALQHAGATMGVAAQQVASAATSLKAVVDKLSREMTEVLEGVKTDLNGVMTGMNEDFTRNLSGMALQMEAATNNLADIMVSVKQDLRGTIEVMSNGFKQNMVGMAGDLRQATDNISTSIGGMSETVNTAMEVVAKNIDDASTVHKRTSIQFVGMSDALSANVTEMTGNMASIGDRIAEGLQSVASSTRQMGSLTKNFDKVAQSLETLPVTLQQIAEGVGNSSANVSNGIDQLLTALTHNERYSSAADAILKMPVSIDELSNRLLRPQEEFASIQKSLTQLVEVANGINDSVQAFKPVEDLEEA